MTDEQVANWVVVILVGGALAIGLISMLVGQFVRLWDWSTNAWRAAVDQAEQDMSSERAARAVSESNQNGANLQATTTPASQQQSVAITQKERNELLLQAKAEALAAMVHAKKIGETDGIKLVFGVAPSSSNPRYLQARDALKAELEKLRNPYPNLQAQQKAKWEPGS